MNIGKRAEELVDIELDFDHGHRYLHFSKVTGRPIYCLRYVLQHEVQKYLVLLILLVSHTVS